MPIDTSDASSVPETLFYGKWFKTSMALVVYNTLTRTKEPFEPLHGRRVNLFVCGITPSNSAHMGHAKTYVTFDIVARYLRFLGYHVFYLQNVTDIEDRIVQRMTETGRDWRELGREYFQEFQDGMEALHCRSVSLLAYATEYMPEIIHQVQRLIDKGYAYASGGSVYYSVAKFDGWGKLSGQKIEKHEPGARIEVDANKRDPADFALWKAQKPGEPAWESPWGLGRPGWHIEDTAIAIAHFGPQYDLHGAAIEISFPHHEAEIAQAEAYTGFSPYVKYWMHTGMLMVHGEEMHKSLGNFWSIRDALKHYDGEVLRFYLLHAHYRSPIDFSENQLEEAKASYGRLKESLGNLESALRSPSPQGKADSWLSERVKETRRAFLERMDDDFNTREALAVLFDFVRELNKALTEGAGQTALVESRRLFVEVTSILGILESARAPEKEVLDRLIALLVGMREEARKNKDYALSDKLRGQLSELGVVLEDHPEGVRWKLRP